jgi:23S rRNA pseudoU1915 N3-methylase RlmH
MYYTLKDIKKFKSEYILPVDVINIIDLIKKEIIVIPSITDSVQAKNTLQDKKIIHKKWQKEIIATKSNFTKAVEDIEKDPFVKRINDIRITLNKISVKNYESQKNIILEHMKDIDDQTSLNKIAHFIFDIASSNKFYCELYTNLYIELINISSIFRSILDEYVSNYKSIVNNLKYVSAEEDFEGFCDNNKNNDKRRSMASFFMFLSNKGILLHDIILDMIKYFQEKMIVDIDEEGKTLECEEISELLYIFISIGKSNLSLIKHSRWCDIVENVHLITSYKIKEHKSLTSRVFFKQLDLKDFLK